MKLHFLEKLLKSEDESSFIELNLIDMGFGGSSSGANVIFKNNRRERKSKTEKFLKSTGSGIHGVKSKEVDPAEILEIRKNIKLENKKRQRKILIFSAVLTLLFILFFWKILF